MAPGCSGRWISGGPGCVSLWSRGACHCRKTSPPYLSFRSLLGRGCSLSVSCRLLCDSSLPVVPISAALLSAFGGPYLALGSRRSFLRPVISSPLPSFCRRPSPPVVSAVSAVSLPAASLLRIVSSGRPLAAFARPLFHILAVPILRAGTAWKYHKEKGRPFRISLSVVCKPGLIRQR